MSKVIYSIKRYSHPNNSEPFTQTIGAVQKAKDVYLIPHFILGFV